MPINNKIIPFGHFKAINLCGLIFIKRPLSEAELLHEQIHTLQFLELLVLGFYLWYLVEWLVRIVQYHNLFLAYRNICFEREAYSNQFRPTYLQTRKHFSSFKYLKDSQS